jgi:hypothetical protein
LAKSPSRVLGEIVYTEGTVSIRRGEKILSGADADIGASVLSYDLVVTGPKSRAEIDLASTSSGGAVLKIAERTAFYFDTATYDDGSRSTLVKLLAGTLAFKVEKLSGGSFTVNSGDTILGVRGTTFSVDCSPDGSILVSCAEGNVACTGSDGKSFSAKPGSLVEGAPSGALAPKLLPVDKLLANRAAWLMDKDAAVDAEGADLVLDAYSKLSAARPAFDAAMTRLDGLSSTLAAWEGILAQGRQLGPTERLEERKGLAETLLVCLKALPSFERQFYRLGDLASRKQGGAVFGGSQAAKASLDSSLASFSASREADEARMGRLRRALYVFSRLEAGTPLGEFFGEKAKALGGTSLGGL